MVTATNKVLRRERNVDAALVMSRNAEKSTKYV